MSVSGSTMPAPAAAGPSLFDPARRPPNVVLIFADDMGYGDLGCFGARDIRTPAFDRMAAEGVRLTQFYVPSPACSPSRAALLTGRYPARSGFLRVLSCLSGSGLGAEEITLAEALKERGYATACIGKWHLGHLPEYLPTRHGFDRYFGIPYSNDMDKEERGEPPTPLMRDETVIEQPVDQDTITQRYTEEAVRFIRESKDQPFFLYLPHTMPHVPLHVSDRFRGRSKGGLYGDVIEEMDWSTGEILQTLKDLDLDANTLVIFTSDNGPWLPKAPDAGSGRPFRDGKASVFEGGVREPFIARWPGRLPEGVISNEAVISMDLWTTIANLAGARTPTDRPMDGEDIWPVLEGTGHRQGQAFFYEWRGLRAYRDGRWKLHLPTDVNGKTKTAELYNMETDPGETTDLSEQEPEVVRGMTERAERFIADLAKGAAPPKLNPSDLPPPK